MSHQVFIEGCRDQRPETARGLASAIASRYGIDPAQIVARLQRGRFQVKANLDLATARLFVEYLEGAGALCSVVDAAGQTVLRSAALQAVPPERDEVSMPELADADEFALHTPPPPPDYGSEYESGLSAASGPGAAQTLGALDDVSDAAGAGFQLSSVDGHSDEPPRARAAGATTAALDDAAAFLPPDMLEERALELDIDGPAPRTPPVTDLPSSPRAESALGSGESPRAASAQPEAAPVAPPRATTLAAEPLPARLLGRLSRDERLRFAVGVAAALIVGFIVVHFFAAGRETERYGAVVAELEAQYAQAHSPEAWDGLQEARTQALASLKDRRSTIVITSSVVWLIVGGLLLFAWLRLVDWSRWRDHGLPARSNS